MMLITWLLRLLGIKLVIMPAHIEEWEDPFNDAEKLIERQNEEFTRLDELIR